VPEDWKRTRVSRKGRTLKVMAGHHGTPGPYVLFGMPKPKEKESLSG